MVDSQEEFDPTKQIAAIDSFTIKAAKLTNPKDQKLYDAVNPMQKSHNKKKGGKTITEELT